MGNRVRKGKLMTTHTVTAIDSQVAGRFNCTNAEGIHLNSTFSLNGTANPGSNLYAYAMNRNILSNGTVYDVGLNWGISVAIGDTVYFNWREHGVQVGKNNSDCTIGNTRNLLLDSRIRRRGQIYSLGNQSSMTSTDFKGTKAELAYIPLILTSEDKQGADHSYANNINDNDFTDEVAQFSFTKTHIATANFQFPANFYTGTQKAHRAGRTGSGAACTNLHFKVLRIPCAYGYMTAANFDNPSTQNSTGSNATISNIGLVPNGGYYKSLGNKRAILGAADIDAFSAVKRGMFISREGTDIETCDIEDFVFGTDTGVVTDEVRGDSQNLAVNYSSVVNSNAIPITRAALNVTDSTATISIFNPYSIAADVALTYSNSASADVSSSITVSSSESAGVYIYSFATTSSSTLSFTPQFNIATSSLALL